MRFDESFIEKVREANDIVDVIGAHTELREKGDRLWGRCPFPDHAEKTPSFSVSGNKQLYYCFGCKKSGNIFTFLRDYQGLSFREAVEFLARRASIAIPEEAPKQAAARENRDLLLKVNKSSAIYFHQAIKAIPATHPVQDYLKRRGLTSEIIEKFRIGITGDDWQGLINVLKSKGAPLQAAETLGLIKKKKTGTDYFDLFRNRIMFPIFSPSSDVLGFGGRTYTDENPKYLNSPETPLFSKGKVLYGLHETGKFIRSSDRVIVVEGYMDAIALYSAGIQNVVAILGTAFTPEHAKLVKRYTTQVTMLLDGDEAGMTAAERSLPILLASGLRVKGCFLPNGQDPDDFVKENGAAALNQHLDNARELFSLVIGRWLEGYKASPGEKIDLVMKAAPLLKATESQQLVVLYIEELAQRLDVDVVWIRNTLQEWSRNQAQKAASQSQSNALRFDAKAEPTSSEKNISDESAREPVLEQVSVKKSPKDESILLSLLLHNRTLFEEAQSEGVFELFMDDGLRKLSRMALAKHLQNPSGFDSLAASLASFVDVPSVITSALELTQDAKGEDDERRLMGDYLTAVRNRSLKNQGKAIANQLRDSGSSAGSIENRNEALEQFMNIQRDRLAIKQDGHE